MNLEINIFNEQDRRIDEAEIETLARMVWQNESAMDANLNIVFTGHELIKELNRKYFNKDGSTDVIAFPLAGADDDLFEGEVYICVEHVYKNAEIYEVGSDTELKRVVAHGLLHLVGYTDKNAVEKQEMTNKENYYLERGDK